MRYWERQQRPRAYNDSGHAHELTFSCFRKHPFLTERTCQWMADEIHSACRELDYSLWSYVFMPDHVHLIVKPRQSRYDDSHFLKRIKERVSRKAIRFLKKDAPHWLKAIRVARGSKIEHHFWQPGRGHDRNIERSGTLMKMIDYIHENPVRRNLVESAIDWKWSSAGWFARRSPNNLPPDLIPWDWLEDLS